MIPSGPDALVQDIRSAWRSIRTSPGFTLTVVLTFALGIGLNSATFSLLDRLYLRPPAGVVAPAGVRRIWFQSTQLSGSLRTTGARPYPVFRALGDLVGDSTSLAVTSRQSAPLGGTLT